MRSDSDRPLPNAQGRESLRQKVLELLPGRAYRPPPPDPHPVCVSLSLWSAYSMNKFVFGALALPAASSLAYAGSETPDWSTLYRPLAALAQNPPGTPNPFGMHVFVRSRFANSSDVDVSGAPGDQDLSGFSMDNARLELRADQQDYGIVIQLEAAPGVAFLLDAYGTFRITEGIVAQMGRFRAPFLWSALIEE